MPKLSQTPNLQITLSIPNLITNVQQSFHTLQSAYSKCSEQNQNYLLQIYLKVLNRVLDDVVQAQQKVRLVDCNLLREDKCVNYLEQISKLRQKCFEDHKMLKQRKEILYKYKNKTETIESQKQQIKDSCNRKSVQLMQLKGKICRRQKAIEGGYKIQKLEIVPIQGMGRTASTDKYRTEQKKKFNRISMAQILIQPLKTDRVRIKHNDELSNGNISSSLNNTLWLYQPMQSKYMDKKYASKHSFNKSNLS